MALEDLGLGGWGSIVGAVTSPIVGYFQTSAQNEALQKGIDEINKQKKDIRQQADISFATTSGRQSDILSKIRGNRGMEEVAGLTNIYGQESQGATRTRQMTDSAINQLTSQVSQLKANQRDYDFGTMVQDIFGGALGGYQMGTGIEDMSKARTRESKLDELFNRELDEYINNPRYGIYNKPNTGGRLDLNNMMYGGRNYG